MTFPTTPILDDFNRADEGPPPSASWANWQADGLAVAANVCAGEVVLSNNRDYWLAAPGDDQEVFCSIVDIPDPGGGDYVGVIARLTPAASTYYFLQATGAGGVTGTLLSLWRFDGPGMLVVLDTYTPLPPFTRFGLRAIGDALYSWFYDGTWTHAGTFIDNTYPSGFIGLEIATSLTIPTVDNFGGGTYNPSYRLGGTMTNILTTPEGPVATSQGGTVYVKRFGDFSRFVWAGECVYIQDIANELGGLNVTTRANAREGGLRRDGVLVDPPGNITTTLSMKRLRGDRLKSTLKSCFWLFDKRTQCNNFDDPTYWQEIERVYRAKVGTRTTTPGTSIMESNAEEMINFDVTALEDYDLYRLHIEYGSVAAAAPHEILCVSVCHGDRCVACGDDETDAVLVAGTDLVAAGTPHIYVNTEGGDIGSWTDIPVTEWAAGDVDGIVCLGDWGAAVSADEGANGEVLYTRDRFTTRVAYALTASHPPLAIDASSQTFIVFSGEDGYIYMSRDGMVNYTTSLGGSVITALDLDGVRIAPSNHNVVYVRSSQDDVIIKTENAGDTWFQLTATGTAGGIFSLDVHPDNENIVLCGTDNGEIFQSTDGGETWTEQGDLMGMTTKANVNIVSISAAGGGVWFAGVYETAVSNRVYVNYEDGADGAWEYFNPLDGEVYSVGAANIIKAVVGVDPNRCVVVGGDNAAADLVALLN